MTYEQASARGLAFARSDGDTLTYRDGVMHHFNAAIVTAITAATQSRAVHARTTWSTAAARLPKARRGRSANTCSCPARTPRAPICWRATSRRRASRCAAPRSRSSSAARTIPAGAYIVSNAQPTARMVRNLLDPKTEQSAEFIKKQEERRKMRLERSDLRHHRVEPADAVRRGDWSRARRRSASRRRRCRRSTTRRCRRVRLPAAKVGYLMPWGSRRRGAVGRCDAAGHSHSQRRRRVHAQRPPLSDRHRVHPQRRRTRPISTRRLAALAVKHGAELVPIDSTWVDEGTSLGSNDVAALKTPKVLLAWDTPTQYAVRRLDALRARAPLRRGRHRRSHQLARRAPTSTTTT